MGEVEWEQVRREATRVIDYLELEENLQHSKRRYSQTTPLGILIEKSSDQSRVISTYCLCFKVGIHSHHTAFDSLSASTP